MIYRYLTAATTAAVVSAMSGHVAAQTANCDAILRQGVFNRQTVEESTRMRDQLRRMQCASSFNTHAEAQNAGFGLTVPVYGVPVTLNGTFSTSQRDTWKQTNCSNEERQFDYDAQRRTVTEQVAAPIVTAWTACVAAAQANGRGLVCTATEPSAGEVDVTVRYIATQADASAPRVTSASAEGLQCSNQAPLQSGHAISFGGEVMHCTRTQNAGVFPPASVTINTTEGACVARLSERRPRERVISGTVVITGNYSVMEADTIHFLTGSRLQVEAGGTISIRANRIIVDDGALIQGNGAPGAPGTAGAPGCGFNRSCAPGEHAIRWTAGNDGDYHSANGDCSNGPNHPDRGRPGGSGGRGGAGAIVVVRAREITGTLTCNVRGGAGGQGGQGGEGAWHFRPGGRDPWQCPSGPQGAQGPQGEDGNCDIQILR